MGDQAFLITLSVALVAGRLGSDLSLRLRQSPVLGELAAGVIVGSSGLGWLNSNDPAFHLFAQIGLLLLLFEVGLECDTDALFRSGAAAICVAVVGVGSSLLLGYLGALALGASSRSATFLGAAISATSIGLAVRVFRDLGQLQSREAALVLGASIADDLIGLVLLAIVGGESTAAGWAFIRPVGLAIAFIVGGIVIGRAAAPLLMSMAERMEGRGAIGSAALAFSLLAAWLATRFGLAALIGAFGSGLVLARTEQRMKIEEALRPVADLFIPTFFVAGGAAVELARIEPTSPAGQAALSLAVALTVAAVLGKLIAGMATPARGIDRSIIAAGMQPRGEVTLIYATLGLRSHLLDPSSFAALVAVIFSTTFLTPLALRPLLARRAATTSASSHPGQA